MRCTVPGCLYTTADQVPDAYATVTDKITLMGQHVAVNHVVVQQQQPPPQPPPVVQQHSHTECLKRPELKLSGGKVTESQWEYFVHSWDQYKTLSNLGGLARSHLEQALGEVGTKVFNRLGKQATDALTEEQLLAKAKEIAVERKNCIIARLKLA